MWNEDRLTLIWNTMMRYQRESGFNITTRKLADKLGLKSNSDVAQYLHELERRGLVKSSGKQFQAIRAKEAK